MNASSRPLISAFGRAWSDALGSTLSSQGVPAPDRRPLETVTVFMMAHVCGDLVDSMRGALRRGPSGYEAVYTLNGERYQSQRWATEAQARADLATHQDALAAAGWTSLPFHP